MCGQSGRFSCKINRSYVIRFVEGLGICILFHQKSEPNVHKLLENVKFMLIIRFQNFLRDENQPVVFKLWWAGQIYWGCYHPQ